MEFERHHRSYFVTLEKKISQDNHRSCSGKWEKFFGKVRHIAGDEVLIPKEWKSLRRKTIYQTCETQWQSLDTHQQTCSQTMMNSIFSAKWRPEILFVSKKVRSWLISRKDLMMVKAFVDADTQVDPFPANGIPSDAIGRLDHRRHSIRKKMSLHQSQAHEDTFSIDGIRSNQLRYISTRIDNDLSKAMVDLNDKKPQANRTRIDVCNWSSRMFFVIISVITW